jgi:hypothetical protein
VNEVLQIVRIEKNINTYIHLINHTFVEFRDVRKRILIHHVRDFDCKKNSSIQNLALRKHMKMHETPETCTKRSSSSSSQINNSLTTDSCSQSPSSFENLAPMKTSLATANYMHTINPYHHHSTAFQQHYYNRQTGFNF